MKLFGYAKSDNSGTLLELDAVSICFQNSENAQKFADFATACAEKMATMGEDYDHDHFAGGKVPDITIEQLLGVRK